MMIPKIKIKATFFSFLAGIFFVSAQIEKKEQRNLSLPELDMTKGVNVHFISPEPIEFVDLSSDDLMGDLPNENIARVKVLAEQEDENGIKKFYDGQIIGVVTIVGQSFMAQYRAVYRSTDIYSVQTNIKIQPEQMQPLEYPKISFSNFELKRFCLDIIEQHKPKKPIRKTKNLKLNIELNNVYVMNDYIFLDITFKNRTNLSHSIEGIKYTIEDKKIFKATNNQTIEINPLFQLHKPKHFRKNFRNIYVFKKFTYPNSKVLKIRLLEEQISGRTIELIVKYSDILNADTF